MPRCSSARKRRRSARTPSAGTTGENLRAAAAAERAERDGSYREAIETCNLHGPTEIAKVFDQTRDSEVEHANLCSTASRDLDSMKDAKTFYVCGKCGYTTNIKLPFCPACQHRRAPVAVDSLARVANRSPGSQAWRVRRSMLRE